MGERHGELSGGISRALMDGLRRSSPAIRSRTSIGSPAVKHRDADAAELVIVTVPYAVTPTTMLCPEQDRCSPQAGSDRHYEFFADSDCSTSRV
jgi:hypothetical protein